MRKKQKHLQIPRHLQILRHLQIPRILQNPEKAVRRRMIMIPIRKEILMMRKMQLQKTRTSPLTRSPR